MCQSPRHKQQTPAEKKEENMDERNFRMVEVRQEKAGAVRALRHELHIPLRYRLEGRQDWQPGEAINMSESGLLFSSDDLLEIDARVQITFQHSETPMVQSSTRVARVVRRILSNWPETRVLFGAKFCN
jgi:PilZ domain-containing protein